MRSRLESLNLSNEFFIPMAGPQAHVNSEPGQCIMKKRRGSEGRSCDGESGAKEPQKDIGKSAREWHFDREGKDNR
jgi:hypothetical protein